MRLNKKHDIFYVDVPNPNTTGDDDSWINIATVSTKKEALHILLDKYGINKRDSKIFIIPGEI